MAVTTEPPWLHKTVGVAPKNGTNSHTITFSSFGDDPFTPTTGSLLVMWVHGAVTNTVAGWTKQAGPIATGELSLFTKVCAGDTSATITHNGSNYAVAVCVQEFPAGSTPNGVDSTTSGNDTAVPLSGLPGTAQVVISALGRVPIGSETGASITPSAPWVEVADQFVAPAGGTDGAYLAVVHQINVTATSINPVISPTYSGTWGNGSREKISFVVDAVAPPAGLTPFTQDYSTTWRVRSGITRDYATSWRVRAALSRDYATTWRVRSGMTRDYATSWRVRTGFSRDYVTSWRVWVGWTADYATSWRVRNALVADYVTTWDVLATSSFVQDYATTWAIRAAFAADYTTTWRVRTGWARDYATTWAVRSLFRSDHITSWNVRAYFSRDYVTTWRVLSDITSPPLPAGVTARMEEWIAARIRTETVTARLP